MHLTSLVVAWFGATNGKNSMNRNGVRLRAIIGLALMIACFPVFIPSTAADDGLLARQPRADYHTRRLKLIEKIGDGIVVVLGAREEDFGEVGRFRQNNYFMYLTGVETPGSYVMLVPAGFKDGNATQEVIFLPPRNPGRERWTGIQVGPGPEAAQKFGITEAADASRFYSRLFDVLSEPRFRSRSAKLHTVIPGGPSAVITREHHFVETVRRALPYVQIVNVAPVLDEMRKIKTAAEIALIQKAVDITAEAQQAARDRTRAGAYEYELQAALEEAFTRNGAERPGFPSIVGSGFYSTILHYNENRRKMEAGEVVVIDIGAEYSFYTADITRTYPTSGKFTRRQREIYDLVLEAQRAAEKAFKPGQTNMQQLRQAATDVMRASPLRDKEGNTLERYFIHGLGHGLGMDVHDVGDYSKPIPLGAVFTIEPGIYIPDESLGVRIEDDYLVTEGGLVKMSAGIASDPDEIERLMSSKSRENTTGRVLLMRREAFYHKQALVRAESL